MCHHTIRYDTRCYFNVRSKADMSRLNLPHVTLITPLSGMTCRQHAGTCYVNLQTKFERYEYMKTVQNVEIGDVWSG